MALLENDQKEEAAAEFRAIQKARPDLAFGYINAAACYALLTEASEKALPEAKKGVDLLPKSAWPLLVQAALQRNLGQNEEVTKSLEKAVKLEPRSIRAVGSLLRHLRDIPGDHTARLTELRKTLADLAPNNLAANLEQLRGQVEAKDAAGMKETLRRIDAILPRMSADARDLFQQSAAALDKGADPSDTIRPLQNLLVGQPQFTPSQNEIFGGSSDPAILLMRNWAQEPPAVGEPALKSVQITWRDVTAEAGLSAVKARGTAPIAIGDVDLWPEAGLRNGAQVNRIQDKQDLVVGAGAATPLINQGTAFSAAAAAGEGSPVLADFNNDFTLDAYIAAPGGDGVQRNQLTGNTKGEQLKFTRGAAAPPIRTPGRGQGSATVADLDEDGDLDILRASADPSQPALRWLRNNGDWTFTDLTASSGLKLPSGGARMAVTADFDDDLDPDIFLVRTDGCRLFLNQRQDVFKDASDAWGVGKDKGAVCAAVSDYNQDGNWDIAVAGGAPHGSLIYRHSGSGLVADRAALPLPEGFEARWLEWVDYDNDGWQDLVVAGTSGVRVLRNERGRLVDAGASLATAARWVAGFDYDEDGDLDLIAVTAADEVRLLRNDGGNGRPWLRVEVQGYLVDSRNVAPGEATEGNNSYAIGGVIEPLTAWGRQRYPITRAVTLVGLAPAESAVSLRVTWPNGIPQHSMAPETGKPLHFAQRPMSSCPYLYVWDGKGWRFAKDFNWRSPLGMLSARDKPVPHNLTLDWDKIPGEWLKPEAGYYRLNATEELREISYFDMMQLLVVDHPEGTGVYVDERFPFGPADPFRIYTTRNERLPVSARNDRGEDLLSVLKSEDDVYTSVPTGSVRGVAQPHDLILDLGDVPDPKNVKLFLSGWIYPPLPSTNINSSQNRALPFIPPTLSVGDGKGGWTGEDRSIGLPCGKRKTIVLDLSNRFVGDDFRVKLTTTYELRWDRAFWTSGEAPVEVRKHDAPLIEADLRERGISEEYEAAPNGPSLRRYDRLLEGVRAPNWKDIAGAYTRLGDCSPLLGKVDDRYAIIAPGDEIRMVFDGRKTPAPRAGWKRDYIFLSDGWTKDSDSNTVTGETVAPLPFHGMKRYPYGPEERFPDSAAHRAWMRDWNTRVKGASEARRIRL